MFSGSPSVCASVLGQRHSPTCLPVAVVCDSGCDSGLVKL